MFLTWELSVEDMRSGQNGGAIALATSQRFLFIGKYCSILIEVSSAPVSNDPISYKVTSTLGFVSR